MSDDNGGTQKVLADFKRPRGEEIRVAISEFKGTESLNIRLWYEHSNGEMRPTQKGVNIKYEELDDLEKAIRAAKEQMKKTS